MEDETEDRILWKTLEGDDGSDGEDTGVQQASSLVMEWVRHVMDIVSSCGDQILVEKLLENCRNRTTLADKRQIGIPTHYTI